MENVKPNKNSLLVLFITSYIPLFVLLILRQIKQNSAYFSFGGFNKDGIMTLFSNFSLSLFLIFVIFYGILGIYFLLKNYEENIVNGDIVSVKKIENKNSESIAYISTYIVPFVFSDTNNLFDVFSIFIVLLMIFLIYIKSDMIIINPILNLKYSLFNIEYERKGIIKNCLLITLNKELNINDELKINKIKDNIHYGKNSTSWYNK